jgi:hypothetical protein
MGSYAKLEQRSTEERREQTAGEAHSFAKDENRTYKMIQNSDGLAISATVGAMTPSQATAAAQTPK